ncbi:MAG: PAS domain S-box protein [Desulfosudaceae bacterium]
MRNFNKFLTQKTMVAKIVLTGGLFVLPAPARAASAAAAGISWLPILTWAAFFLLALFTAGLVYERKRLKTALAASRQREQELRRTEELFHVLENNIHDVIFTLDMDFRFTYMSPSVKRQRGYTAAEAMALDISQTITPASAERITNQVARGLSRIEQGEPTRTPLVMGVEIYCKNGSTRLTELTADFLYDDAGRPRGMIGVSRYIEDREKVKSELLLFKQAVEGTSEAIGLATPGGRHFYHNQALADMFGYATAEELEKAGGPPALVRDTAQAREIITTLKNGRPWSGELIMYHRDGREFPVYLKADLIRDENGTVLAQMGSMTDISALQEKEAAARYQESLYRLLADNISETISIIDLAGQCHLYVSPSVERLRGFTQQEVMVQTIEEFLTPASYEEATQIMAEELARDNQPGVDPRRYRTLELEQYRKDGSTIWTEVMAAFLRDDEGRPVSILTATRDITERKKAETAIRQSEERYRMLAENISEAIYTIDLQTLRHTYSSPSVKRMYGFTPEEFNARPIEKVMTPESLERTLATVSTELGRDGQPGVDPDRHVTLELELYRKDGSTIWVETTVKILRDAAGAPVSALGMARDITERKKAETALRESEELYRLLADNTTEIISIVDLATEAHLYISPAVEKLKGFTVEEALNLPLQRMVTPASYQLARQVIAEELARDGQPGVDPDRHRTVEVEQVCKNGSTFWTEAAATFLRDDTGRPVSLLTASRDISERKKAESVMRQAKEAAEAANRAKSEFLANMSHEIRTPMNGVIGMTELLLDTDLSTEQQEYAESVKNSAEALLVIINDLLDFSKIEAGKLSLEVIDFDLKKLLREIERTVSSRLRQKPIGHNLIIEEEVPDRLRGDPIRLRQILINLCDNAVKFTKTGSIQVRIAALEQDETRARLRFEVTDTGVGIPAEHQEKIFESFSQVDASTTRKYGGTGLGLAITKRLVAMLQGEVGISSQPGQGSTFWFTAGFDLPDQETAPQPEVNEEILPATMSYLQALQILLVEDNTISRQVIVQMLEKMGHAITIAVDGEEAVRMFAERNFDLVLMDIQMPVMDGVAATRKIQSLQQHRQKKAPVIAITANAMDGDRERLISEGLDDYIAKPVSLKTLAETIQRNVG